MQFHQVPLNFLPQGGSADYLITGTWSQKAIKEARLLGEARVAASSEDRDFTYIPAPDVWELDPDAAFLHFTSNNTIYGTQFQEEPEADVPLVCDMSSDFLSRPVDLGRYGLIYAGAQKNVGPAGVTVVLVKRRLPPKAERGPADHARLRHPRPEALQHPARLRRVHGGEGAEVAGGARRTGLDR